MYMKTAEVLKTMASSATSPSLPLPFPPRWTQAAAQALTAEVRKKGRPSSTYRWTNPIRATFVLRRHHLTDERGAHAEKPGSMARVTVGPTNSIKTSNAGRRGNVARGPSITFDRIRRRSGFSGSARTAKTTIFWPANVARPQSLPPDGGIHSVTLKGLGHAAHLVHAERIEARRTTPALPLLQVLHMQPLRCTKNGHSLMQS